MRGCVLCLRRCERSLDLPMQCRTWRSRADRRLDTPRRGHRTTQACADCRGTLSLVPGRYQLQQAELRGKQNSFGVNSTTAILYFNHSYSYY